MFMSILLKYHSAYSCCILLQDTTGVQHNASLGYIRTYVLVVIKTLDMNRYVCVYKVVNFLLERRCNPLNNLKL